MKTKGQLEWTEYLNAQLLHTKPTGLKKVSIYGAFTLIGAVFLYSLYSAMIGQMPFAGVLPAAIILVLFILYRYVFLPRRIKKIFFQQKSLHTPFEMELTEEGFFLKNESSNSKHPWNDFIKWKENDELLLLYHSDIVINIIPKRLFPDYQEVEKIKTYLDQNNVPVAKSNNKGCIIYTILFLLVIMIVTYMSVKNNLP